MTDGLGPVLYEGIFCYRIYVIGGTVGKFICKDRGGGGKQLYLYIV